MLAHREYNNDVYAKRSGRYVLSRTYAVATIAKPKINLEDC
jgi:hypothetical protein